jgi:Fe-S cluster biosynthesis and repair protein YggX
MKRPIFLIDCQGKTAEQISAEAWAEWQKYQAANDDGDDDMFQDFHDNE